jgi:hydrogenase expression/formation protein HypE
VKSRTLDLEHGHVDLTHGAGGRATARLVSELFAPAFHNRFLAEQNDAALLDLPPGRVVMSTDAFVVSPLFFPGGDIGKLAVHGTVNDLAMAGARPLYLTASFILEEGLALRQLARIVESMAEAAREAGVLIVAGDTKVVERGKGDGIFVTTAGVGVVPPGVVPPGGQRAKPGDAVLLSGHVGDHGMAILSCRQGLEFESPILSDTAPLGGLVAAMTEAVPDIHTLRDPTRGGLATTLNEIASQSKVGIRLRERDIPVRAAVAAACELLGLDPLYVANEGKLLAICAPGDAARLLAVMRAHPHGRDATIVGEVIEDADHFLELETAFGGSRILEWLSAEQLPRIC